MQRTYRAARLSAMVLGRGALILALALTGMARPAAMQAAQAAVTRVRIGVVADGVVAVGPADLAAAGVAVASSDPRSFALSSQGQAVALYVTGEADGRFDAEDRLYFFGQRFRGPEMEQKYTDERIYWLTIGGPAGPRMAGQDATPQGDLTPPSDFATTLHAEESLHWFTHHTSTPDSYDTWFWAWAQPFGTGSAVTVTLPAAVPHPVPTGSAVLRVEQIGRMDSDHRSTVGMNGVQLATSDWYGKSHLHEITATLAASLLASGVNTVTVASVVRPGVYQESVYTNFWELAYRRQFRAWADQLDFVTELAGAQEYQVDGFTATPAFIWDVSNPLQPVRQVVTPIYRYRRLFPLAGVSRSGRVEERGNSDVAVRFRTDAGPGAHFWLQTTALAQPPASLRVRPETGLAAPAGGADAVIVAPAEFFPAAERLATWHRAHGRRAVVVDVRDVYDEFNAGIYHPKAIQAMMAWASQHWVAPAPAYLILMGDGHWNFKGYNVALYPVQPNPIPPYLAWVDPVQGEVPAEALFGDIDGDQIPDLAVGRLAVNTLAEAQTVVDKIVAYDETARSAPWQRQALFVADAYDSDAGNFAALSDEIIAGYLPPDLAVQRIYLPSASAEDGIAAHAVLLQAMQAGPWMVQYAGHASPAVWSKSGQLWRISDAAELHNAPQLPVVFTFNCLDGYYAYPIQSQFSIAEMMQRQPGGGSVAAISPTGLGYTPEQHSFRKILMDVLFKDQVQEIGLALTVAKRRYAQTYGVDYMVATMALFGDPALRLPVAAP